MKLGIAIASKEALPSAFVVFRDDIKLTMEKVYKLGYEGVELALLDDSQIDIEEVRALCQKYQLEIPMISSGQVYAQGHICLTSSDKGIRNQAIARMKGLIDIAEQLGSMVNIGRVRGPIEDGEPYGSSEQCFIDSLEMLALYAEPKGVQIALEPVNRYELNFINTLEQAQQIILKTGRPNIKIMPDTFHMNIEERCIEASLVAHKDLIAYIHFAESNRWAPGTGHLNFPNIINALKAIGYEGYVTVEILPHPNPDAAALQAANYLKTLL
ncbi:MAG: TIM barrel protein [Acidobacteriota bacterium]